ncbi:UBX domain-containing protein 4 [Pleurostoma richardsiae]|uniref:UBX domain-containing protein 2 n=1 Tax=Pleurostoma richardsiae TaxID=41990 RepID=A0AA38VVZ3_9PEZI|nr:UBX domain-containing protein 4 [Pleurostoma richardsiae]
MFFQGNLQEGISTAVQQSKFVVCFVTDGKEESEQWESSFLKEGSIAGLLDAEAVVLRLQAGSEEAGYLAAIFPIPKTPTLVIIRNGELKEYVAAGVAREEFVRRVYGAFRPGQSPPGAAEPSSASQSVAAAAAATAAPATEPSPPRAAGSSSAGAPRPPSQEPPSAEAQLTAQRAAQIAAAAQQQREAAQEGERRRQAALKAKAEAEAERRRIAKGKMPSTGDGDDKDDRDPAKKAAVRKASQQYAERQRQMREERQRVLQRIEDDRAERRAREEERRAVREAELRAQHEIIEGASAIAESAGAPSSMRSGTGRRHDHCSIQVRLFDGSTIRTRLPSTSTLRTDVRKWVDESRQDGSNPYEFKVLLTPLPNRSIDAVEEEKSLDELGLTPSATLVLIPVDRYSAAYAQAGGNPVSRIVAPFFGFFAWIVGVFTGFFGTLFSTAGPPAPEEIPLRDLNRRSEDHVGGAGEGSRQQRDYQLYNGNSLNFEPRKDDDDDN